MNRLYKSEDRRMAAADLQITASYEVTLTTPIIAGDLRAVKSWQRVFARFSGFSGRNQHPENQTPKSSLSLLILKPPVMSRTERTVE